MKIPKDAQDKLNAFTKQIDNRFQDVRHSDIYISDGGTVGVTGFGLAGESKGKTKPEYYMLPMIISGYIRPTAMETVDEYIKEFENFLGVLGTVEELWLVYRESPEICYDVDSYKCRARIAVYRKIED